KEGETVEIAESPNGDSAPAQDEPPAPPPPVAEAAPVAASARSVDDRADAARVKASPLARRMARERGLDLARVTGTGPDGRIVAEDIEKAAAGAPALTTAALPATEVEVVQLTSTRKTIARRL